MRATVTVEPWQGVTRWQIEWDPDDEMAVDAGTDHDPLRALSDMALRLVTHYYGEHDPPAPTHDWSRLAGETLSVEWSEDKRLEPRDPG